MGMFQAAMRRLNILRHRESVNVVLRLVSLLILMKLVNAQAHGQFLMSWLVVLLIYTFSGRVLFHALMQQRLVTQKLLQSALKLSSLVTLPSAGLLYYYAQELASWLGDPMLAPLLKVNAVIICGLPWLNYSVCLLQLSQHKHTLDNITQGISLLAMISAIMLAGLGFQTWALIGGMLIGFVSALFCALLMSTRLTPLQAKVQPISVLLKYLSTDWLIVLIAKLSRLSLVIGFGVIWGPVILASFVRAEVLVAYLALTTPLYLPLFIPQVQAMTAHYLRIATSGLIAVSFAVPAVLSLFFDAAWQPVATFFLPLMLIQCLTLFKHDETTDRMLLNSSLVEIIGYWVSIFYLLPHSPLGCCYSLLVINGIKWLITYKQKMPKIHLLRTLHKKLVPIYSTLVLSVFLLSTVNWWHTWSSYSQLVLIATFFLVSHLFYWIEDGRL